MPKVNMRNQPPKKKDPYAGGQHIYIVVPIVFRETCKMLQVPPAKVIDHLIWDIGRLVKVADGLMLNKATNYFISCGYGQERFTKDQIEQMIIELSTIMRMIPVAEPWVTHEDFMKMRDSYIPIWRSKWKSLMKRPSLVKPNKTYHE